MSKRWLLLPLTLILLVTAAVFVIPIIQRNRTCDDFPAPVIASGANHNVALSCWPRVTFEDRVYAGFCYDVEGRLLGDYLRKDLDGPRLKMGYARAVRRIVGVPVTDAFALKVTRAEEQEHGCRRDLMVMFETDLSDRRFREIERLIGRRR